MILFNLGRMPPYIPGVSIDPTSAPPRDVAGLAVVTSALGLPGSARLCSGVSRSSSDSQKYVYFA